MRSEREQRGGEMPPEDWAFPAMLGLAASPREDAARAACTQPVSLTSPKGRCYAKVCGFLVKSTSSTGIRCLAGVSLLRHSLYQASTSSVRAQTPVSDDVRIKNSVSIFFLQNVNLR